MRYHPLLSPCLSLITLTIIVVVWYIMIDRMSTVIFCVVGFDYCTATRSKSIYGLIMVDLLADTPMRMIALPHLGVLTYCVGLCNIDYDVA